MIGALALLVVEAFLVWLLSYCLRVGRIGSRSAGDATRIGEPIRYWTRIVILGAASAVVGCLLIYLGLGALS